MGAFISWMTRVQVGLVNASLAFLTHVKRTSVAPASSGSGVSVFAQMADFSQLFTSAKEHLTPVEARIRGELPKWLKGSFVRLGPGLFDLKEMTLNHWFDGFAVLHKFDFADGKVIFTQRFLESDAYKKAVSVGRPVFTEFGTRSFPDPCRGVFSRMMSTLVPDLTDNNAVNVFTIEDGMYVASETNILRRVDPTLLETLEKVDLNKLVGVNLASSHVLQDKSRVSYTLGTSMYSTGIKYHIVQIPPNETKSAEDAIASTKILATIGSSWKTNCSYYHSFGMSENYIVFIEQPLVINGVKLVSTGIKGKSLRECMDWYPDHPNRFVVIKKSNGEIIPTEYKSKESFFLFHHINTFEKDGQLIVDVIAFNSAEIVDKFYLNKLRESIFSGNDPGGARRFVLPLHVPKTPLKTQNLVSEEYGVSAQKLKNHVELTSKVLTTPGYELPTINKQFLGRQYRYFYACGMYDPGPHRNSLLKVDTETGQVIKWKENEFCYPGEAQFIPSPNAEDEDDGIILTAVTDVRKETSDFLLVLDARNLTEIARAQVNVRIANLTHGIFFNKT